MKNKIIDALTTLTDAKKLKQIHDLLFPCEHKIIIKKNESAQCQDCKKDFGWYCPDSSDHICQYFSQNKNNQCFIILHDGTIFNLPADHNPDYETDDSCLFCGNPEERK